MRVAAVIPALDEAATIAAVVTDVRAQGIDRVVVVDGGSGDGTVAAARACGAEVVIEPRRGYGRACMAGARRAMASTESGAGAEVVVFLDGSGAAVAADLPDLIAPIVASQADLVLGKRRGAGVEAGALRPLQRLGNHIATWMIAARYGHRYADLGSPRAIRSDALRRLELRESHHGWPVEMQVEALRRGLRVAEVAVRYRRRRGGRSKVSGSLAGSWRAGRAILRVVWTR